MLVLGNQLLLWDHSNILNVRHIDDVANFNCLFVFISLSLEDVEFIFINDHEVRRATGLKELFVVFGIKLVELNALSEVDTILMKGESIIRSLVVVDK